MKWSLMVGGGFSIGEGWGCSFKERMGCSRERVGCSFREKQRKSAQYLADIPA